MINLALEGESDRGAASAVVRVAGHSVGKIVVAGGKTRLDPRIPKYNLAAQRENWVVLRDSDGECPFELRQKLTSDFSTWSPRFALRIVDSMTEAWLLADRDGFADYFHVRPGQLPSSPDGLAHAKRSLLAICARSSSKTMRSDVVAFDGNAGPLYVARMNDFASTRWDVTAAAERSESLARAIACFMRLP